GHSIRPFWRPAPDNVRPARVTRAAASSRDGPVRPAGAHPPIPLKPAGQPPPNPAQAGGPAPVGAEHEASQAALRPPNSNAAMAREPALRQASRTRRPGGTPRGGRPSKLPFEWRPTWLQQDAARRRRAGAGVTSGSRAQFANRQ